MTMASKMEAMT